MHVCIFGEIKKLQILVLGCLKNLNFLGQQRSLNSINKLLFYKFPGVEFIPQSFNFSLVAKFFNLFRPDIFSVCSAYFFFRFSQGDPLIYLNIIIV